jgi:hypothetical protein
MLLKNEVLFKEEFRNAFFRLIKQPFPSDLSLQLIETLQKLGTQQVNVFKVKTDLVERLVFSFEEGSPTFRNNQEKDEFYTEMEKLLSLEFEIPLKDKIQLSEKILISGEDIINLKPILAVNF